MKKIITGIIIFIITLLVIIGIFWNKGKDNTKKKKITIAEVAHSIFYTPMYVAHSKGFFDEFGLDVDITLTSGADAVAAAVISGDAEVGFCGSEQSIYIYNGKEKDYLINFAALTKRDGSFIVSRKKGKFNIQDLVGKHIIAGREGGMPAMTLAYTLKEHGIDTKDLTFDTSIAFANMNGAFISGIGDYVTVFEPSGIALEKAKAGYVVASLGKLGGEVPYTSFQARKSYIKKNPDVIENFTKAIQKGLDYTFKHTDKELAEILGDYFPDTTKNDLTETIKRYREADSWYKTTYISKKGFDRVQDIIKYSNKLEKKAPYNKLVITKYSKK